MINSNMKENSIEKVKNSNRPQKPNKCLQKVTQ